MQTVKKSIQGFRFEAGQCEPVDMKAITEASVTITVNGEEWLALLCTPSELEALAVGFLFNEGVVQSKDELASVRVCPTGDIVDVWLNHAVQKPAQWRRTSGCAGGMTAVENDTQDGSEPTVFIANHFQLNSEAILRLVKSLFQRQDLYQEVGGVHTSALADGKQILLAADDIGRHNTLDKIAGRCLLDDLWPKHRVLITTGRVSSEMMQKAARIGAAVVISRTAPTSLSIELADRAGITLIGYARQNRFSVYSHAERIHAEDGGCLP